MKLNHKRRITKNLSGPLLSKEEPLGVSPLILGYYAAERAHPPHHDKTSHTAADTSLPKAVTFIAFRNLYINLTFL